ncbi:MAG: hypothetical protein ACREM2_04895 [Vulcanimicrobiaceae bacterium]
MSAFAPWRHFRVAALGVAFLGASLAGLRAGAAAMPAPHAPPRTSCAPQSPLGHSIAEVLAFPIEDGLTLRAIARLASLPAKQQAAAFSKAVAAEAGAPNETVAAAVQTGCLGNEVAMRTARLLTTVANEWDFDIAGDPRLGAFADAAETALGALAVREQLSAATVDAALAPFDLALRNLENTPATAALDQPCAPDGPARVVHQAPLTFPGTAEAGLIGGQIFVEVSLDDAGLLESATILKTDYSSLKSPATESLVSAAKQSLRTQA